MNIRERGIESIRVSYLSPSVVFSIFSLVLSNLSIMYLAFFSNSLTLCSKVPLWNCTEFGVSEYGLFSVILESSIEGDCGKILLEKELGFLVVGVSMRLCIGREMKTIYCERRN